MILLLLACSNTKLVSEETIPAIYLYNGVFYKVLKRAVSQNPKLNDLLDIHILSAKYGLIPSCHPISFYDLKMTKELSDKNKHIFTESLLKTVTEKQIESIMVVMGKTYRDAFDWDKIPVKCEFITGEIGIMQSNFKKWLLSI